MARNYHIGYLVLVMCFVVQPQGSAASVNCKRSRFEPLKTDWKHAPMVNDIQGQTCCMVLSEFPETWINDNLDVLTYHFNLDIRPAFERNPLDSTSVFLKGDALVSLVFRQFVPDTIIFHAYGITPYKAKVNGSDTGVSRLSTQTVGFGVSPGIAVGDTISLSYSWVVTKSGLGFYYHDPDTSSDASLKHKIVYTFSQPESARAWFPCNDVPSDKAFFSAQICVPDGVIATANGALDSTREVEDGVCYSYRSNSPMPTYLFAIAASEFELRIDSVTSVTRRKIPIHNYAWAADWTDSVYNAGRELGTVPEMLRYFEGLFGPYPFESYGHVVVHPIMIGGMEHQTLSTINRLWLKGGAQMGIAHELVHQWYGDLVTCASWKDLWLNEGAATYGEVLWAEYLNGIKGRNERLEQRFDRYMRIGLQAPRIWDPPRWALFLESTTYAKAAWVFHMIRTMVGDSAYFENQRRYMTTFRDNSLQTTEFIEFWKQSVPNPIIPWEVFFDQWLLKSGHPIFSVSVSSVENDNTVELIVRQDQAADNVPNVFHVPMQVSFELANREVVDTTLLISAANMEFSFEFPSPMVSFTWNSNYGVLCEEAIIVTSVPSLRQKQTKVVPIALSLGDRVPVPVKHIYPITVSFHLQDGRTVFNRSIHHMHELTTSGLAPGVYIVLYHSAGGYDAIPVMILP